jgi:SAM-dependent methyltransferase
MSQDKKFDDSYGNQEVFYNSYYKYMPCDPKNSFFDRYVHYSIAKAVTSQRAYTSSSKILELASGSGQHFNQINYNNDFYLETDIRFYGVNDRSKFIQANAASLPFRNNSFDFIIATCLLMHVNNPEKIISECLRVTKSEGYIILYLPCEPGILLSIFRQLVMVPKAKKLGFEGYDLFIAREHRNHYYSLTKIIEYECRFNQLKIVKFPFKFLNWMLNAFSIAIIRV